MSIYKACDIRGAVGTALRTEEMEQIGLALAEKLQGKSIAVGGDFCTHTPMLKAALLQGLLRGGAEVFDVGQLSTPQLYFSRRYLGTWACAQVTASHNPPGDNGLKLLWGDSSPAGTVIGDLEARVRRGSAERKGGVCRRVSTDAAYAAMLSAAEGPFSLRVVIDAGNGAMSRTAPAVMAGLGAMVVPLFCICDGTFPNRPPNPTAENLTALCRAVRESGADFGVAFDGDGDRAAFVTGGGVPIRAEQTLLLLAKALLLPGDRLVYDLKCSSMVPEAVEAMGGVALPERSGHGFIRQRFLETGSRLAGEASGHFFFRELQGDDGLYAAIRVAALLQETGKSLETLLADWGEPCITPDLRIYGGEAAFRRALFAMERWALESGAKRLLLDGIRLEFRDRSWILLRKSVTEQAYTVRMEAGDPERLAQLRQEAACRLSLPEL